MAKASSELPHLSDAEKSSQPTSTLKKSSSSSSVNTDDDIPIHHPLHYIYCLTKNKCDGFVSISCIEQYQTEKACLEMYRRHFQYLAPHPYCDKSPNETPFGEQTSSIFNAEDSYSEEEQNRDVNESEKDALWEIAMNQIKLKKKNIFSFCGKYMDEAFPENLMELDASRGWMLFWIAHTLELLNLLKASEIEKKVLRFLDKCWDAVGEGGWGGGPGQLGHLATTYACCCLLLISENTQRWISPHEDIFKTRTLAHVLENSSLPDPRYQLYRFLMSRKNPQGGFAVHRHGEIDMRGTYCAIAIASMFNMITPELEENIAEYMKSCQTYEGGIAAEPNHEAHGGYTYCALATLCILGKAHELDLDKLLEWTVHRQMGFEGGFQGRTQKLVDSCYSFWVGAILSLIAEAFRQCGRSVPKDHLWFDEKKLQQYLLCCCQASDGGFTNRPPKLSDFYHTCYAVSGMSVAQNCVLDGKNKHVIGKKRLNSVAPIHILYNVRLDKAYRNQKNVEKYPFVVEKNFIKIHKEKSMHAGEYNDFPSPTNADWGKVGDAGFCGKNHQEYHLSQKLTCYKHNLQV